MLKVYRPVCSLSRRLAFFFPLSSSLHSAEGRKTYVLVQDFDLGEADPDAIHFGPMTLRWGKWWNS